MQVFDDRFQAESTSGHMILSGEPRKKIPSDTTGNRSRDRLVAHCLNHYATPAPLVVVVVVVVVAAAAAVVLVVVVVIIIIIIIIIIKFGNMAASSYQQYPHFYLYDYQYLFLASYC